MPQPLFRVKPNANFLIDDDQLRKNPELATKIAEIVSSWSMVENNIATIFIMLIGGRSDAAMAIYQALEGAGAKDAALRAVARNTLSGQRLSLFEVVTKLVKRVAKQRNTVVHGLIGTSEQVPGSILIISQRDMAAHMFQLFIKQHDGSSEPVQIRTNASEAFSRNCYVYSAPDLDNIVERCRWADSLTLDLAVVCAEIHHARDRSLSRLLAEPLVQRGLSRLNEDYAV